jgi:diaminohydroxyphosphoribosylaminopyrimidine deaminase/5-amino-6-(5-phosphoribosylamino)uracil reductase
MRVALRLAKRAYGWTSPNPIVGAVLVRNGQVLGEGWHHGAGQPHAEIEAVRHAQSRGHSPTGATLYVTLEPCSTHGRTPPCTDAIVAHGISRVVAGTNDPNPRHAGKGLELLRKAGVEVESGLLGEEATRLNEAFNYWIVERKPLVIVKAAVSADGKIATSSGESRWITGERARSWSMGLRQGADAILVGVRTVLLDDPQLTVRKGGRETGKTLRRLVLDPKARTPVSARLVADAHSNLTTIIATAAAPPERLDRLAKRVNVLVAPTAQGRIDISWLLARLGKESVTSLLVEGGGETNAAFLFGGFTHRIAFFYAPKIIGGRTAPTPAGGTGIAHLSEALTLTDVEWRSLGPDLLLTARLERKLN